MSLKTINGKKINVDFKNPRIKDFFLNICEKAPKQTVDWDKFRKLDSHKVFSDFTNAQLSLRYRTYNLRRKGLCWYCGGAPATTKNGCCEICDVKVKKANNNYNQIRGKLEKV